MNEKLKKFLEELDEDSAEEIWLWLDGNPDAISELIEVVAKRFEHGRDTFHTKQDKGAR